MERWRRVRLLGVVGRREEKVELGWDLPSGIPPRLFGALAQQSRGFEEIGRVGRKGQGGYEVDALDSSREGYHRTSLPPNRLELNTASSPFLPSRSLRSSTPS